MLHFIIGQAGSGKTHTVRRILTQNAALRPGKKHILIVPEQYSFESERAVLGGLGMPASENVEVLSFTRLVNIVSRECGGLSGRSIDDSGRAALMSAAVKDVSGELTLLAKQTSCPEFIAQAVRLSKEFKRLSLPDSSLHNVYDSLPDGLLRSKLRELEIIFRAYDAYVSRSFLDSEDYLDWLYDTAVREQYFRGCNIYIDSFTSFIGQQYKIIEEMIREADDVYITLCSDSLHPDSSGIFAGAGKTAGRLMCCAKKSGAGIASPIMLTEQPRFAGDAVKALARGLFAILPEKCSADGVTVRAAENIYGECTFVADKISELVRKNGFRYRDIAVITRDPDSYRYILPSALRRSGIPYFYDKKTAASSLPLFTAVGAALRAAAFNLRSEDVFTYLKQGLCSYGISDVGILEQYTLVWGITGGKWLDEWTAAPGGFEGKKDASELDRLNAMRRQITDDLTRLRESVDGRDGRHAAEGIFRFLEKTHVGEHLHALCTAETADIYAQSWDALMHILDQTAEIFGEKRLSAAELCGIFDIMAESTSLGEIPQHMDEVMISDAQRIRTDGTRAVFLIGANDGVFPQKAGGGILTSDDRRVISSAGIDISLPGDDETEDRFLFYSVLCSASERVYITYPTHDLSGSALLPSEYIDSVEDIFDGCRGSVQDTSLPHSEDALLCLCAESFGSDGVLSASLEEYLRRYDGAAYGRLCAAAETPAASLKGGTARRLFGDELRLSASKVETFYNCPFSYFCKYGIGAAPLRKAEIDSLLRGTMLHFALENMLKNHGGSLSGLSYDDIRREVCDMLKKYIADAAGEENISPTLIFTVERMSTMLAHVLIHISGELEQSRFAPSAYELKIGWEEGDVPPLTAELADGGRISITGFVDRVDTLSEDGRTYVRIIDYKSGRRIFDLSDVMYGQNMQMLIYLFTLCRQGGALPAGILYMPVKRSSVRADKNSAAEDISAEYEKQLRMNGLILGDEDVVRAMERDGTGRYIPASFNKDGSLSKRSSAIGGAGFEKLEQYVIFMLKNMGMRLHGGDIGISPRDGTASAACGHCDYRSVCRLEPSADIEKITRMSADEIEKKLDEVCENGC